MAQYRHGHGQPLFASVRQAFLRSRCRRSTAMPWYLETARLPIAFRCPRLRLAVTSCIHPAAPPNLLPRQKTCTRTVSRKHLHLHCERCLSACLSVDEDRFRSAFAVPFLHNDATVPSSHKKAPLVLTDKSGDSTLPPTRQEHLLSACI